MTRILSFDIGIVNMAYCVMDRSSKKIIHWEVFSLCNSSDIENCKDLVRKLDQRNHIFDEVSITLLERQPKVNPKMKAMASTLRTYLVVRQLVDNNKDFRIIDYSPKYKLMCWTGPVPRIDVKSEYYRRKKLSIFQCEKLIEDQEQSVRDIYSESQSKKDDLADCYLQCLSFIMFDDQKKEKTLIIKKRPTTKQYRYSKFTKSNLRYILDNFLGSSYDSDGTMNLSQAVEDYLDKFPRVRNSVGKLYGTEYDKFVREVVPNEWSDKKFNPTYPKKVVRKKIKFAEELEENSD